MVYDGQSYELPALDCYYDRIVTCSSRLKYMVWSMTNLRLSVQTIRGTRSSVQNWHSIEVYTEMLLVLVEHISDFYQRVARYDGLVPYMRNAFKDTNPHLRSLGQVLDRLITLRVGHFTRQYQSIQSQISI